MANQFIINKKSSQFIGVDGHSPKDGDSVNLYDLHHGKPISAYWEVVPVLGGYEIQLQADSQLRLGVDNSSTLKNGALLKVYKKSGDNTLWSGDKLLPFCISLKGNGSDDKVMALDSDGKDGKPQLWELLRNDHQKWSITALSTSKTTESDADFIR
jgi:hypothetical protein